MLVVEVLNVAQKGNVANYKYEVWVTTKAGKKKVIAEGKINKFNRAVGWRKLIKRVCNESEDLSEIQQIIDMLSREKPL